MSNFRGRLSKELGKELRRLFVVLIFLIVLAIVLAIELPWMMNAIMSSFHNELIGGGLIKK